MWGYDIGNIDFSHWTTYVPVGGVGVAFALAVFLWLWNRVVARRSPAAPAVTPAAAEGSEARDPFIYGSAEEKRVALRRQGSPVVVLISDAAGRAPPRRGTVLDRSVGGLGLELEDPVEVGSIISVRPERSNTLIPWVQVEVRSCRRADFGWQLGCQFVKSPPSSVLWLFG